MVRTPGFHPGNRGSIPRGVTKLRRISLIFVAIGVLKIPLRPAENTVRGGVGHQKTPKVNLSVFCLLKVYYFLACLYSELSFQFFQGTAELITLVLPLTASLISSTG